MTTVGDEGMLDEGATDPTTEDLRAEVQALRQQVADQRQQVADQQQRLEALMEALGGGHGVATLAQAVPGISSAAEPQVAASGSWTRRALLLGGAGAAVGAAASVAGAGAAAAATGNMQFGATNNSGDSRTLLFSSAVLTFEAYNTANNTAIFGSTGNASAIVGNSTTGVGISGASGSSGVGVRGDSFAGVGVWGSSQSSYGVFAESSGHAAARLRNGGTSGPPTEGAYLTGAMFAPSDGSLWWCVQGGTPGVWRLVTSAATAAFVPVNPTRVYDSRVPQPSAGVPLAAGTSRDISVANGRDLVSGAVTVANLVPAGARAVALNLTVANGTGLGTVALAPGGAATFASSAINFSADQRIANGLITAINPATRQVRAFAITSSVAVIIDITGYFR